MAGIPAWDPICEGTLWVVAPHPDDEVLGAGGLVARRARDRRPVEILSLTDGEAAFGGADPALGRLRHEEMLRALRALGSEEPRVHRCGLPDGALGDHEADLVEHVARRVRPGDLLVAPVEWDGHPDHDAAGRACRRVARERGVDLRSYAIWAWHRRTPRELLSRQPVRLSLDATQRRAKRDALRCHASQLGMAGREPILPPHVRAYFELGFEVYFP
jgi:LmbE family N-acetylglucosaminyl deacetylase